MASAAATADLQTMRWLCEKGAVEVADPGWLWEALAILGSSRKKSAVEALVLLGQRLLVRLQAGEIRVETSPLKKAVEKLRRAGKKRGDSDALDLASSFAELIGELEAEEDEVIELTNARRFERLLAFIKASSEPTTKRRAGLAMLWGVRKRVWLKIGGEGLLVPDPAGYPYLEEIVGLNPDVHLTDGMGRTALMYAVWGMKSDLACRLVELGADLRAVDWESGRTVLEWARASAKPAEMAAWVEQALQEATD